MNYFKLIKLNATASTNDYLKKKHKTLNAEDGDFVWANNQTSGRGQRKNKWFSQPEKSLTFSIYRDFRGIKLIHPFLISAVISVNIIKALEDFEIPNLSLKWPNDILSCNKKIGGILIENFFSKGQVIASIIGIGLNLNQESFHKLPNAGSLKQIQGDFWSQKKILQKLIYYLENALYETNFESYKIILENYKEKLWKRGLKSIFIKESKTFKAKIIAVNCQGKLILQMESKKLVEFDNNQIQMIYTL